MMAPMSPAELAPGDVLDNGVVVGTATDACVTGAVVEAVDPGGATAVVVGAEVWVMVLVRKPGALPTPPRSPKPGSRRHRVAFRESRSSMTFSTRRSLPCGVGLMCWGKPQFTP